MRKLTFFLLLTSFTISCFAQIKVAFSPEYKLPKSKVLSGHLHSNSTGHYTLFKESNRPVIGYGTGKTTFIIEKYDKEFKQVFSKEYESSKKGVQAYGMRYFKNKFAWVLYEQDKKRKSIQYYITPIDMNGKAGTPKTIAKFQYESRNQLPRVKWGVSKDTSSIIFVGEYDSNEKDEKFQAYVSILDNNFEKKWRKKFRLPYSQKRVSPISWEISNDGTVYFVAKIYDDNKTKEDKKKKGNKKSPAYDISIYYMNGEMEKPEKYELDLKDSFAKGMNLEFNNDGNLNCIGFFGDSKNGPVQGLFYLQLDKESKKVSFANKRRFTPKELSNFGDDNTSKDKKSKDSGLDNSFAFKKVSVLENGEIYATAEESYSYTVTTRDSRGNMTTRTVYVRNSIISINIDKEGVIQNVGIIPKRQSGSLPLFFSYALLEGKDQLYYLYNEDEDNLKKNITDPDKIKRISSAKDCVAVLTTIDDNNKINREALFSRDDSKTLLIPQYSRQISDSELFFFTTKYNVFGKTDLKLGTISLQ